jgi:hypothetical protein
MTSLQQTAMQGGAASAKTASYTLVAADAGTAISMSNASATTITVNTALFAAGDTVHITNLGVGVCTITAGTATVNSSASLALAQYESGFLDFTSTSAAIFVKGAGAAAGGGANWSLLNSGGTALSGASTTVSGISSIDKIMVLVVGASNNSNGDTCLVRFNSDTGANYGQAGSELAYSNTYAAADFTTYTALTGTSIALGKMSNNSASAVNGYVMMTGCNASGLKVFNSFGMASPGGGTGQRSYQLAGFYNSASTISSVTILYSGGTLDAGTVYVYTSA